MISKKRSKLFKIAESRSQTSQLNDAQEIQNQDDQSHHQLQSGQFTVAEWQIQQILPTAGSIRVVGNKLKIGLPKQSQTIYPGETARIDFGWQTVSLPINTYMTTFPNKDLLNFNIISIPQIFHFSQLGYRISQLILNNGDRPLQILLLDQEPIMAFQNDNLTLQMLQFDFSSILNVVLQNLPTIIPVIIGLI